MLSHESLVFFPLPAAQHSDDMATLRAVEMRAQQENFTELAERAARRGQK
jgi:hypothetical protein